MLRIGEIGLNSRVLLAPIAGHCDLPFRLVARSCGGVGLAFTDLLCPHGVLKQNRQTRWLMATHEDDQPLGMQLYGRDGPIMAEAARWAVDHGATTIDINMGCPVDKVTKTFAGSMMLCTPDHTVGVAERLVRTVGDRVPVTAKLRLGFEHEERTAAALARRLIEAGIACITIHGRTAAQRFRGTVDIAAIAEVVAAVHEAGGGRVPCIGNGDIQTPFDAQRMIEQTGCDGVMIGRAALGAPWIFRDTAALLATGELPPPLTFRERLECVRRHFHLLVEMRDTRQGLTRLRQKISAYGKHLGPCKPLRAAMQKIETAADFDRLIDRTIERAGAEAERAPITWPQRAAMLAASRGDGAAEGTAATEKRSPTLRASRTRRTDWRRPAEAAAAGPAAGP